MVADCDFFVGAGTWLVVGGCWYVASVSSRSALSSGARTIYSFTSGKNVIVSAIESMVESVVVGCGGASVMSI